MSGKLVKFYNCRILRNHRIYEDYLWVCDGKIVDPEEVFFDCQREADVEVDLKGAIIAPGFIDIQINGGFGIDFAHDLSCDPGKLGIVARGILSHGVTSFCPTLVTSKPEVYHKTLKLLKRHKGGVHGAEILGAHTEGPFISEVKKGAHELKYITHFKNGIATLKEVYGDMSNIKIITLAPEKECSMDVIKWLVQNDIVVCLGHSEADVETGEEAIKNGAKIITHLFNAMLPFHHRNPGLIGLLGINTKQTIYYGLIADGIHTHTASLRIAYRANPDGVILVTDAVSAMGLGEGVHHIGDKEIEIRGNHAYIANTNTLCGSIATMDKCIKTFMNATQCSLSEALEAASLHPAIAIGVGDTKGNLNFGSDADLVVIKDDLTVISTWIAGECVYGDFPLKRKINSWQEDDVSSSDGKNTPPQYALWLSKTCYPETKHVWKFGLPDQAMSYA